MEINEVPKSSGIYCLKSKINGKVYIGSSINLSSRCYFHFYDLVKKKHHNIHLQNHYNKYGKEDLVFSVIESFDFESKEHLLSREQFYLDTLNPEFNILKVAGSNLGLKFSEESKSKMGKSRKGIPRSEETRKKISESNTGKKASDEARRKMSESHMGVKLSDETRRRMSKPRPEETKRKMSESRRGTKSSEKTKETLREAWVKRKLKKKELVELSDR
jgi:group I intron endonuclease